MGNLVVLIVLLSSLIAISPTFAAADQNKGFIQQAARFVYGKLCKQKPSVSTEPIVPSLHDQRSCLLKELLEKIDQCASLNADGSAHLTKEHMKSIIQSLDELIQIDPFFPIKEGRELMRLAEKLNLLSLQILFSTYQIPITESKIAEKLFELYSLSHEWDIEYFIEKYKNIHKHDIPEAQAFDELPSIIQAVMKEDISAILNHLVDDDDAIFIVDYFGNSALHYAYFYGKKKALITLLEGPPDAKSIGYDKKLPQILNYRNRDGLRPKDLKDLGITEQGCHLGPDIIVQLIKNERWDSTIKLIKAGAYAPTIGDSDERFLLPFEQEQNKKILVREFLESMNEKRLNNIVLDQLIALINASLKIIKPAVREDFIPPEIP